MNKTDKKNIIYLNIPNILNDFDKLDLDLDSQILNLKLILASLEQRAFSLTNDDDELTTLLQIPNDEQWNNRIKPQIIKTWVSNKTKINSIYVNQYLNPIKVTRKDDVNIGFQLDDLLIENCGTTILYEASQKDEQTNIWDTGISLLINENFTASQARSFFGKLVKQYGAKNLSAAISSLITKEIPPIESKAYLIGLLKKNIPTSKNKNNYNTKGRVVL